MNYLPILPILIPLFAAVLILALTARGIALARFISLSATALTGVVAVALVLSAETGAVSIYVLGNWTPPFGIVLVVDRLAATMVAATAAIALPALMFATAGTDTKGQHFHVLFQFQIAGLNGAFLTGDIFNLFVFFEVLLIASYGLLVHGGGAPKSRAGLHYVVLNLSGSTLFLIALALIYGTLGTLNMADIGQRLAQVPEADQAIVRTAFTLLVVVFALKAALLPLGFWLPHAYTAATPAVAALFAVMTKVGVYAILRITTIAFVPGNTTADILAPWLVPLALATVAIGMFGMLAARSFSQIIANFVLVSTGLLLTAIGLGDASLIAGIVFYLPHTITVTAALFLLAGYIAARRGAVEDRLERDTQVRNLGLIGLAYLMLALSVTGLPPLAGFLGKVMLLNGSPGTAAGYANWAALILSGFVGALVLARAASALFWEALPSQGEAPGGRASRREVAGLVIAVAWVPILTVAAAPISKYARDAADQLVARQPYTGAVLPAPDAITREIRPGGQP